MALVLPNRCDPSECTLDSQWVGDNFREGILIESLIAGVLCEYPKS